MERWLKVENSAHSCVVGYRKTLCFNIGKVALISLGNNSLYIHESSDVAVTILIEKYHTV